MKAVILAGGIGKRLRPLTNDQPKIMVSVAGRPLIDYQIAYLKNFKLNQIAINIYHCPDILIDYLGDGHRFGVKVTYWQEKKRWGSAGAIKQMTDFLDQSFIVLYGDVLTTLDLNLIIDYHRKKRALMTLSLFEYQQEGIEQKGLVAVNQAGRVVQILEKPKSEEVFTRWINAGIYVAEPALLREIPAGRQFDFGHDLLPRLVKKAKAVYGFKFAGYLLDVGTPKDYQQAQKDVAKGRYKIF